jgi:WS/DGAT/MGAT family acyltransferase
MANKPHREPISKVDTTWLRMEQPTNLMMITGVITLDSSVSFERLVQTVEQRFLAFRRFRQKAVDRAGGAYWEDDEDFDILTHVRRVALPGKADRAELEEYVSDLASTALNPTRPLWQYHYVENYVGGPVVVQRIHHCYADGIALIQVFLSLTDPTPEARPSASNPDQWKRRRAAESGIFQRLLEPARDGVDLAVHWSQKLLEEAVQIVQEPERAGRYAAELGEVGRELMTALTLPDDPQTLFKGRLGVRKQVAWADPIPLAEVKAVSKIYGCTVNDVLISAVTGALRRYMESRGESPDLAADIRATVPVNLRPLEHAHELGNQFGLVFLSLPVGEDNPVRRLRQVRARMNELKNSKQASVALGLLAALGMGPSALQKPALDMLSDKASMVLTNVPGPQQALYLAGGRIKDMMFWVPQNGSIGMGVSILSYDGSVFFGLITDRRLVAEPRQIIDWFMPEFEKLVKLAMMLPGDAVPSGREAESLVTDAFGDPEP